MLKSLTGTIESLVYRNPNNNYTVFYMQVDDELVTAVGRVPIVWPGEVVTVEGDWSFHAEYGKQFDFLSCERRLPDEMEGMVQYLSSGCFKGVGPITALRIVMKFRMDTFDVIQNHPEYLTDIHGINSKKALAISKEFMKQSDYRSVMSFFRNYIKTTEINRVYDKLGIESVARVRENPYFLCHEDLGITFNKADEIAVGIGYPRDGIHRIKAGVEYVLRFNATANGHTCLPLGKLIDATAKVLELDSAVVSKGIDIMVVDGEIVKLERPEDIYAMTAAVDASERYIVKRILEMRDNVAKFSYSDASSIIQKTESELGISYADLQREALFRSLMSGVTIITGGPGTGKTTIVKAMISIFSDMGLKTVLSAPTGRAAKRLSEATSCEAKTIHRLLEMEKNEAGDFRFRRNALSPLEEDVVIVDEASMVDLALFDALLHAIPRGARLVLIGDADQLPSVGSGNVLGDLISSGVVDVVRLKDIFRQSKESLIITNAHNVNSGIAPVLTSTDNDFFFVRRENEHEIAPTIASLILERLPKTYGKDISSQIQVISPSRKGLGGIDVLNRALQEYMNPPDVSKREKLVKGMLFRVGDKVIQTVNNYEIEWVRGVKMSLMSVEFPKPGKTGERGFGVFNGDIGVIDRMLFEEGFFTIKFDDRLVKYPLDNLEDLELAYAITVHKSQGSEYPVVIIPVYNCNRMLMTRNLLYTGITRAKKMVILVGRAEIPGRMAENNLEMMRYTMLASRLTEGE